MNPTPTTWDQIVQGAGFLASLAAIFGVPFLIYQVKLARDTFIGEQTERQERRQGEKGTILSALRAQVKMIQGSVRLDLNRFSPADRTPDVEPFVRLRESMGPDPYATVFVWTPLPMNTVEQAIQEAHLLGLQPEEVQDLQELQLKILRANTAVNTKFDVLSALAATAGGPMNIAVVFINRTIENQFGEIERLCTGISQWLEEKK